jgi:polyisoprenoid-binding protein YceI
LLALYLAGGTVPGMAAHLLGPDNGGTLVLKTGRQGLVASAGHDLTIAVDKWSGEAEIADDPAASTLRVTVRMDSLRVVSGTGGLKPLSDRDRREIAQTARKILDVERHPEAVFTANKIVAGAGGGTIEGTLTLVGKDQPLTLTVTGPVDGRYRATGTVIQTNYGIKPYTAFFGTLKLADAIGVEAEFQLPG